MVKPVKLIVRNRCQRVILANLWCQSEIGFRVQRHGQISQSPFTKWYKYGGNFLLGKKEEEMIIN